MNIEREALAILAERGWARFDFGTGHDGPLCVGGALTEANLRLGACMTRPESRRLVLEVLREQYPDLESTPAAVLQFNDRFDTTLEDVVAVLEKASIRRDEVVE